MKGKSDKFDGHRDDMGRFAKGNPGGPGRPSRAVEEELYEELVEQVRKCWPEIVAAAITDALAGKNLPRRWLSEYVLGRPAVQTDVTVRSQGSDFARFLEMLTAEDTEPEPESTSD